MSGSQMNHEALEKTLRFYFAQEGEGGDLSPERWQAMLAYATAAGQQRRNPWFGVLALRPVPAVVVTLVVAVIAGGVSLWIASPWEGVHPSLSGTPVPTVARGGGIREGTPSPAPTPTFNFRGVPVPGSAPGRPAPRYLESTWKADGRLVAQGEPFTITVTLTNTWDQPIETKGFPNTAALDTIDQQVTPSEEAVMVPLSSQGGLSSAIQPGEPVTLVANVSPEVSAKLQPGRYSVHLDVQFGYTPQQPDAGTTRIGLNSGLLFVVIPPEGALNKTVEVGRTQQVSGISITLESVQFAPEQTTIVATAVLPASSSTPAPGPATPAPPWPQSGPTPTPTPVPTGTPSAPTPPLAVGATGTTVAPTVVPTSTPAGRMPPPPATPTPTPAGATAGGTLPPGAPTPTPTPAPLPPGIDTPFYGITAWYRLDGGPWRELHGLGWHGTPEGVHLEWALGPVSANAQTFDVAVTRLLVNVGQRVDGLWEWSVPLQAGS